MSDAPFYPSRTRITCSCQQLHPEAVLGIALFNQHKFFEAHEALETAWREETGALRELYRGILQVGVAYYHIQRGNYNGARKLFQRARRWLAPFPKVCCGVPVADLLSDLQRAEEELLRLGPDRIQHFNPGLFKPVEIKEGEENQ